MIIPRSRTRVLDIILSDPGMLISSVIRNARANPRYAIDFINEAVREGIITEELIGGEEKVHARRLYPNMMEGRAIFCLVEMEKRIAFLKENPPLRGPFSEVSRKVRAKSGFALVFGSYARSTESEDSDLDVLVVCDEPLQEAVLSDSFVLADILPSVIWETEGQFSERRENPLHLNIRRDHIVIYGEGKYLDAIS
ncbi:MAG: nucleotidyltransferase domain-containing protein [Methanopyri archaeon]|nr:nucleotidyltransferase domain-containing protein [Methanopyri archaeon]|tara:strand:+ start:627 stop:1214 length:588 start_codon:yes stop_codon:yes gene_type:complete